MNAGVGLNMKSQREKTKGAGSEALLLSYQAKGIVQTKNMFSIDFGQNKYFMC
jgi:hypothetical protein